MDGLGDARATGLLRALAFGVQVPYRGRKTYRQRKDLQRECSFLADGSRLILTTEGAVIETLWSDYLKWKEGKAGFLLYMSDNMYRPIPKRFFASEADIAKFREMVGAGMKQPSRA